jgi:hypothetical protein
MTRKSMQNGWMRLGFNAWTLGVEAASVVALRSLKLAKGGPDAKQEADLMLAEKVSAGLALQVKAMSGALGVLPATVAVNTLTYYRRKVRANRRRLSR